MEKHNFAIAKLCTYYVITQNLEKIWLLRHFSKNNGT